MHIEACKRRLFLIGWLPNISPPFYTPESVLMDCVCPEHVHLHFVSLMNVLIPQKRSLSKTWKLLVNKINTDTVMIWGLWLKKKKKNFNFRLLHLSYSGFLKKCQCCHFMLQSHNPLILIFSQLQSHLSMPLSVQCRSTVVKPCQKDDTITTILLSSFILDSPNHIVKTWH